ncbi:hypothetical protein WOLCODRAFT_18710 [Wolfiporia cocos MD-104 SS10]|uniref:Uncharacterized protein n=1 Tax=Wolfiporia cocos (strain MD-104) TaxID=742152 RepID=A0A2H3K4S7_WOLCO|nr:hypothetical protein WOLCODRAFT_18710 [Wolfiporia cocos MD-104 SS10]
MCHFIVHVREYSCTHQVVIDKAPVDCGDPHCRKSGGHLTGEHDCARECYEKQAVSLLAAHIVDGASRKTPSRAFVVDVRVEACPPCMGEIIYSSDEEEEEEDIYGVYLNRRPRDSKSEDEDEGESE